jgi:hypothetical protein
MTMRRYLTKDSSKEDAQWWLLWLMKDLSQEAWYAGWMMSITDDCKNIVSGKIDGSDYGMGISQEEFDLYKADLIRTHEKAGGWWEWLDDPTTVSTLDVGDDGWRETQPLGDAPAFYEDTDTEDGQQPN